MLLFPLKVAVKIMSGSNRLGVLQSKCLLLWKAEVDSLLSNWFLSLYPYLKVINTLTVL